MQLTNLSTDCSQEEFVYSEPKSYNVKNSKLTYERIHLSTKYQKKVMVLLLLKLRYYFHLVFLKKRDRKKIVQLVILYLFVYGIKTNHQIKNKKNILVNFYKL